MEFFDNAAEIADFLIEEEGIERALDMAGEGIDRANAERDFYLLSVWREVRMILHRRQTALTETEPG